MSISIRRVIGGSFILAVFVVSSLGFGMTARAQTNTSQSAQIAQLMQLIAQLQIQLAQMQNGSSSGVGQCIQISRTLLLGSSDSSTLGEVSKLQQFLKKSGHYPYVKTSGYFDPATQLAVQMWQKANGIVSNGSPETTGYGVTGPLTRSAMAKACKVVQTPDNIIVSIYSISNSENPTISGEAEGADTVSLNIYSYDKYSNGYTSKIYSSGDIKVLSNAWSHKVPFDLTDGKYFVKVISNGQSQVEKLFKIDTDSEGGLADSVTVTSISNFPNPVIKGIATGVSEISLKVYKGEKTSSLGGVVYDSESISDVDVQVVNGKWSHQVLEYLDNGIYTLKVYIDNKYGQNLEIAQKVFKIDSPQSDGDSKVILEVLPSKESNMIALGDTNQVIGKELIAFTIDADRANRDVKFSGMTVSLALPFVKAGVWTDLIKNVVLVSEGQPSINMSESIDSDKNTITLAGQVSDEIMVVLNNTGKRADYTIPKGTSREFRIIADFNPANVVGGFGRANSIGQSTGYVQANIENIYVQADDFGFPIFTEPGNNMRGKLFSIKGPTY